MIGASTSLVLAFLTCAGSQLCGPKVCFYFTCCLAVSIMIVLAIFCQPVMNLVIQICVKLFI